ncbi:MbtH family protein [Streptomyces sp. NPDC086777]|uniref:MbtH family protein n=1 Tax=Streptomyces sp. NPDC086777 TaxID=3154866 RepID=UPI00344F9896
MSNPFEFHEGRFVVLQNEEAYHSLWPAAMKAPVGWRVVLEESSRQACLDYVTERGPGLRSGNPAATPA